MLLLNVLVHSLVGTKEVQGLHHHSGPLITAIQMLTCVLLYVCSTGRSYLQITAKHIVTEIEF